jgi:acyl-phosphate glycerol 3-phosphate acyltransferase
VVIFDFSKGALPIWAGESLGLSFGCALAAAVAAVIGHSYPIYFRFRGGKGLAAALGALLLITPLETFMVLPVLGFVYLVVTGSAVTGALVSLLLLVGLNIWQGYSLLIIISPLILLTAVGIGTLPEVIQSWRSRADKGNLIAGWLQPKGTWEETRSIAVVTDSVASLTKEMSKSENVFTIPLTVILPNGDFHDGVDINPSEYYRQLHQESIHPKTSAPSPGEYLELYRDLARRHKSAIVVTPPKELSQTYDSALLGSKEAQGEIETHVIDSRAGGLAQGFVAMAAARTVLSGAGLDEVLAKVEKVQENVGLIGVPKTMNFLAESGRVNGIMRWVRLRCEFTR